jgi:hypothetical protein
MQKLKDEIASQALMLLFPRVGQSLIFYLKPASSYQHSCLVGLGIYTSKRKCCDLNASGRGVSEQTGGSYLNSLTIIL